MSLYKFFESQIEEVPEIILLNHNRPFKYDEFELYFQRKQQRFPTEIFLEVLFYDYLCKNTVTIDEFEKLRAKTKKIAQIAQKFYKVSIIVDKLEREGNEKRSTNNIMCYKNESKI